MKKLLYSRFAWARVFAPDGDGTGDGTGTGTGTVTGTVTSESGTVTGADDDRPAFTQKQVNKMLAEDRRKHEDRIKQAVEQLETAKKAKGLSDKERTEMQSKIEDLNNSLMTKEQLAKKELEKKDKEYKQQLDTVDQEKIFWQSEYSKETAKNQILSSVQEYKGVRSEQFVELLMPKTRLVELVGDDGKGLKKFVHKIKYLTKNDKNEEVELDLTIPETIKRMKEEPERFGNLFESGFQGGLGGGGSNGGGSLNGDRPPNDPEAYRAWRKNRGMNSKKFA